jgi:hypothetical protein
MNEYTDITVSTLADVGLINGYDGWPAESLAILRKYHDGRGVQWRAMRADIVTEDSLPLPDLKVVALSRRGLADACRHVGRAIARDTRTDEGGREWKDSYLTAEDFDQLYAAGLQPSDEAIWAATTAVRAAFYDALATVFA